MCFGSILLGASDTIVTGGGSVNFTAGASAGSIALENGASILTGGGNVSFNDAVILGTTSTTGTVTVNTTGASGAGNITFGNTVDGAASASMALIANAGTGGAVDFVGVIGSTAPLTTLTATGQNVTLSGIGATSFAGVGSLAVTAATLTTLSGSVYHSSGSESFSGSVLLGADETVQSDTGSINFGGAINGAHALSLFAASGTVSLGNVGASTPLTSLLVDPTGIVLSGTTYDTTGDQTYSLGVTLGANATLASTAGSINFLGTIDGPFALSATASSGLSVGGLIGSTAALSGLTLSASTVILSGIDHTGSAGVSGGVSITGTTAIDLAGTAYHSGSTESFSGPVVLLGNETITSDSGDIRFVGTTSTINSGASTSDTLSLNAGTGHVSLGGAVGASTALGALLVSGTGTTTLSGGSIATTTAHSASGAVSFSEGVILAANETVTSTGGNITFSGPVNGTFGLSLFAAAGTVGLGNVGATTPLTSLLVDPAGIVLSGTTYDTSGNQTYSLGVTLGANATLISDKGSILFLAGIDGAHALSVGATSGSIGVVGLIGGTTALSSLSLDGATVSLSGIGHVGSTGVSGIVGITGTTAIDLGGSAYHSGGSESFTGPVVLLAGETVISDAGSITFHDKVDGTFGLTATGLTTFDGAVGSTPCITTRWRCAAT